MTSTNFPLTADSGFDDLPRTLRREKEARAREARERREKDSMDASRSAMPSYFGHAAPVVYGDDPVPAAVRRFDVPFFHLMMFFLKAVLAAIPAMLLLGVVLYLASKGFEAYFPDLIRMKILIAFPGG